MNEQTDQLAAQAQTVPARIALEDFIEAVSRGIARAGAATNDVSGYALGAVPWIPVVAGIVIYCPMQPPSDPRAPLPRQAEHAQ